MYQEKWNKDMTMSSASSDKLIQCHPDLQRLFKAVAEKIDIVVSCGWRGEADQEKAFSEGKSKEHWPNSKHNEFIKDKDGNMVPRSMAVDAEPLKRNTIDWNDRALFYYFAGYVMAIANGMGIKIRWGGNWQMQTVPLSDQKFSDLPHFEIHT